MIRAVALVRESQALVGARSLYSTARAIPGVVDAYPSLGGHDGVVFVEARNLRDLKGVLHHVEGLPGVREMETLVEDSDE